MKISSLFLMVQALTLGPQLFERLHTISFSLAHQTACPPPFCDLQSLDGCRTCGTRGRYEILWHLWPKRLKCRPQALLHPSFWAQTPGDREEATWAACLLPQMPPPGSFLAHGSDAGVKVPFLSSLLQLCPCFRIFHSVPEPNKVSI